MMLSLKQHYLRGSLLILNVGELQNNPCET